MKQMLVLATVAALAATGTGAAFAREQARVLSAVPVVQQMAIPQQVCGDDTVYTGPRTTGGGALLGTVIGGLAGSAIGNGGGRVAATAIGAMGGAIVGNQVEANGQPSYQTVRRCSTETVYENRTVGYDVTYEYAGRRYTTRTAQHPGQWMDVTVQPAAAQPGNTYSSEPVFVGPNGVYTPAPAAYIAEPGYSVPMVVDVNVGGYPGHRPPPPRPYPGYWR